MQALTSSSSRRGPQALIRRVILVEDDASVRQSMTLFLRSRGLLVDAYRSGLELLSLRTGHGGDCLVIDYKMPQLDGLKVLQNLRNASDETPAILITGYYSKTLRNQALTAGYSDVLEKPTDPGLLLETISLQFS